MLVARARVNSDLGGSLYSLKISGTYVLVLGCSALKLCTCLTSTNRGMLNNIGSQLEP